MYPLLALALAVWLAVLMGGIAGQNRDLSTLYRSHSKHMQVVSMAEAVEQYFQQTSAYPASIATLMDTGGFEDTRSLVDGWQGYGVSPTLNDGVWQFQRAVLVSNDPSRGVDAAAYMSANFCGTGGYDNADSWCGSPKGHWFRRETRESFSGNILTQRARMNRFLQKLANYYNSNSKFPDKDALHVDLATNSISTLASLASYSGTAGACSGTFTYMDIPIDCGDMFDQWGGAIGYQFLSGTHVVMVSEPPIVNAAGNRVVVAADFDNSLL